MKAIKIISVIFLMVCFGLETNAQSRGSRNATSGKTTTKQTKKSTNSAAKTAKQVRKPQTGTIEGHEWVDLGLPSGLKWATCNVGASSPEDSGNYYAWGETSTKSDYSNDNSLTYLKSEFELYKGEITRISGILESSHDAASVNWGGSWRMPTNVEIKELAYKCTWTWTTQNGMKGYRVTGPNGKSIFLPASGRYYGTSLLFNGEEGHYWSASGSSADTHAAHHIAFDCINKFYYNDCRSNGKCVRPVSD